MITHAIARRMLAGIFISGGLDAALHPDGKVAKAESVGSVVANRLGVDADTRTLVRANGALQMGAAGLLFLGRAPRLAATALAASLVPTTLAGHRFWEERDPKDRAAQRIQFLKNVAVFGGLLLVANDPDGRPSFGWRARHAADDARHAVGSVVERAVEALPLPA